MQSLQEKKILEMKKNNSAFFFCFFFFFLENSLSLLNDPRIKLE